MSVLVERVSGAQVLPPRDDQPRQTVTAWLAQGCCSADQRRKYPEWYSIAHDLIVVEDGAA